MMSSTRSIYMLMRLFSIVSFKFFWNSTLKVSYAVFFQPVFVQSKPGIEEGSTSNGAHNGYRIVHTPVNAFL